MLSAQPLMRTPLINAWPPLPPDAWLWPPPSKLPFPLEEPQYGLFAFGRQALWHAALVLELSPGDEMLVPAYNHGSEVEALVRAGIAVRFYGSSGSLEPDEEDLEARITDRTRALYLIHYNGFPQDSVRWRSWCDERGLLLVEDAAQAWLAERDGVPVGSLADIVFYCAYKTYGLPEGALLFARRAPSPPTHDPGPGPSALARRHGLWLAQRSSVFTSLALRRSGGSRYDFELSKLDSMPWSSVARLLPRLAAQDAAAGRRANYRTLSRELGDLVPEPFRDLPPGASPFFFPVRSERKEALLARLAERGVKALDVWSGSHAAHSESERRDVARRRATTVGIPVHQELRIDDLDRIVAAVADRPRRRAQPRLESVDDIDALGEEWDALAQRAGNLFATREWISSWWRQYGDDRRLTVTACRDASGRLFAILPLYEVAARPVRILRFLGHGAGDRLGPICAAGDVERTARALASLLGSGRRRRAMLLAEQLPGEERWAGLLGGARLRMEPSPVLRVDWKGFDEFIASRSRNFRDQVGRRERKLARQYDLRYRLCDDHASLERDLQTLFDLHEARWGRESSAFDVRRRAFHREFAQLALARGWLRLWTMELDGRPVAAWYGFRYANMEWYYQAGRDPSFDRQATGFVLLVHTVRAAMDDGVREYRLLRGGEEYKGRFANADPGLETFVTGHGAAGVAAAAGTVAAAALPRSTRRHVAAMVG